VVAILDFLKKGLGGDKKARLVIFATLGGASLLLAFLFSGNEASSSKTISLGASKRGLSQPTIDSSIWVDVVGSVKDPGVYSLKPGSRVFELVALAGGFLASADQSSINLARNLTDGEQINVLARGSLTVDSAQSSLISINSATAATLETLPGVGPKLAARIVDWRNANSGFKVILDLRKVGGIGDKLFAAIKDLISL